MSSTTEGDWLERLRRPYASGWRLAVGERLSWLRAMNGRPRTVAAYGVDEAIQIAHRAVTDPRKPWERVKSWWSGWDAERAWRAVHAAEVELVASSDDLGARLAGIRQQVANELPADDRRRRALEAVRGDPDTDDRVVVADAMRAAFAAADDALTGVRGLRNRMVVFGILLTALNVLLGVLASLRPELVPLCVGQVACPSRPGAIPTGGDVWTVQVFGTLGAVVAVVVLLVRSRPGLVTYQLPGYQSLVKITLGATLAVVGVLGIAAGAFEAVIGNQPALLVAALVLGYAQQAATRFLDDYAERLVGKAKAGVDVG